MLYLARELTSKIDNYLSRKTIEILSNEYTYIRQLQLKTLLNLQARVQEIHDRLTVKLEQN